MPSPKRRSKPFSEEEKARLLSRVTELETRVRQLEARLRNLGATVRRSPRPVAKVAAVRRRPRCPGCTLELPKGRKGDACVWCGFRFDVDQLFKGS